MKDKRNNERSEEGRRDGTTEREREGIRRIRKGGREEEKQDGEREKMRNELRKGKMNE